MPFQSYEFPIISQKCSATQGLPQRRGGSSHGFPGLSSYADRKDRRRNRATTSERNETPLSHPASLVFPVVTLPVEITSQIFLHCLPDNPFDPSVPVPAVVLGHVCRHWRDIALSVPQLWSSYVKLWLARSQNQPLSIRVYPRDGLSQDASTLDDLWLERTIDFGRLVLPNILPHCQRWKRIELSVPIMILRDLSSLELNEGLPNLTHLVLGCRQEDWGDVDDEDPITLFNAAPQLRNLHIILETQNNLGRFDRLPLPFHQLTSFTGTMFGALECIVILVQMPALVDCVFYVGPRVGVGVQQPVQSLTLPHLKSLKLWSTAARNVHGGLVLDHLTLPSLETLLLGRGELHLPPVLQSLCLRSACTIRHFACESVNPEELADVLETLPMLSTLELLDYSQNDAVEVIRHLHYRLQDGDGAPLVPHLERLTMNCGRTHQDGDFPFTPLIRLLDLMSGRPTPPGPLSPCMDHGAAAPQTRYGGGGDVQGHSGGGRDGHTYRNPK
ncbi:hypothetical protein FB451DRAFT_1463887 [Mycena latifolia]|nr:hypothetical protein FB451DRAFT_1463887 [Mycena latifolia]